MTRSKCVVVGWARVAPPPAPGLILRPPFPPFAGLMCPIARRVSAPRAAASVCPPWNVWVGMPPVRRLAPPVRTGSRLRRSARVRAPPPSIVCSCVHACVLPVARVCDRVPVPPACAGLPDCASCAAADECAWCASESKCMAFSDVFASDCRGTVFNLPCPASFVGGAWLRWACHAPAGPIAGWRASVPAAPSLPLHSCANCTPVAIPCSEPCRGEPGGGGGPSVWRRIPLRLWYALWGAVGEGTAPRRGGTQCSVVVNLWYA